MAGIVGVIVFAVVAFVIFRYKDRGQAMPKQSHGNPAVEITLTILPALILIGVGVRLGATQGLILTVALTLEILFLGLSVVAEVTEAGASKTRAVVITIVLGLVTAVGAIGGAALLGGVSETVMAAVLAFGAAALLYLVVEELLVEAHEEKENVWLGAMFFLGCLVIYVLAAMGG